ncbi:MAG: DUF11 domain-containing protein [Blastochloris sp.]|nr:DUF11 domain-containing protein [Blastochloris sp.]
MHTGDATADTLADPRPLAVGETITYRLVTTVPEATLTNLVLIDTLAANIEFVAGSARIAYSADNSFGGSGTYGANELTPTTSIVPSFDAGTGELRFAIGEIVNNDNDADTETLIVEFSALVIDDPLNTPGAQWNNSYSADETNDGVADADSNLVTAELVQPELTLAKTRSGSGPVIVGNQVNFELTLSHSAASSADAFGMSITDSLPTAGMRLDAVTGGTCSGVTTSEAAGTITFGVPTLALNTGSCTIQYAVIVGNDVQPGTTYTNNAQATYATVAGANGRTLSTNPSSADFTTDQVNLSLSKTVTPSSAEPGATITYTLQFSNTGFSATNVVITDTLPAEIVVQSSSTSGDVAITNTASSATEEVFAVAELRDGQSGVITIVAELNTGLSAGTLITNSAVIAAAETDADPGDNSAADSGLTVLNAAPLVMPVAPQTISETNLLALTLSAADLNNDPLTFSLSGAPAGANIDPDSGLFTWTPTNAQGPGVYAFDVIVTDGDRSASVPIEVTVIDTDISYSVTVEPSELIEGNSGIQPLTFTITRNGATYAPSEVDFSLGGSATSGADYNAPGGPIAFAADELTRTLVIDVVGDLLTEPVETIAFSLSDGTAPAGGIITYGVSSATATIVDDDAPGVFVTPTNGETSEAGATFAFEVRLLRAPAAPVTITLQTSDPNEGVPDLATLVFTDADWEIAQTVIVSGVDDGLDDGDVAYSIISGATASADSLYNNLPVADVSLINRDDDESGVSFAPTSLTLAEPDGSGDVDMALTSRPTAVVTIAFTSSDPALCSVTPATISFTPQNWDTRQSITIGVIDDSVQNDPRTCVINGVITSDDAAYAEVAAAIDVTVTDDETATTIYLPLLVNGSSDLVLPARSDSTATWRPVGWGRYDTRRY